MNLTGIHELVFLDRYAKKGRREDIKVGDTVVVTTKEDPRWPTREVGIVEGIDGDRVIVKLKESGDLFTQDILKVDLPLETKPDQMWDRMAAAIMEVEPKQQVTWHPDLIVEDPMSKLIKLQDDFRWLLDGFRFSPGGRINAMLGANRNLTAFNCLVLRSPKDSRKGILKTLEEQAEAMAVGFGVGINLSPLRPRYSYVRKVNGKSSGSVSWADIFSEMTNKIEQGGSRRGALMLILNDFHPDIEEFIEAKKDPNLLNYCNVSVGISDDFMVAIKEDREWQLKFPDYEAVPEEVYENEWDGDIKNWEEKGYPVRLYKTVRARDIWNKIIESAWASAEPGVVFLERCNKESNSYYFNPLICTNPCGKD